ncbi:hypothetical protein ACIRD2_16735 [Streptomyces sp. NPDC093595]|uniref:hypothetical protein n=1 Tax=Streptomyces sp. NPDC093595 TaxID=3366045 RepID=UPI0038297177
MTSTADTTQHPDVSEISDLTEGLLSPSRMADVRRHLESCALCADVRTSLEEIRGLLGTLPGPSRMPADIAGRIDAALAAEALLDATAPAETDDVSRETTPAPTAVEPMRVDRPAGRPRAATGPGRGRATGRRRRNAVLGAVFGVALVGASVLLLQSVQQGDGDGSSKTADISASAPDNALFSGSPLDSRVQTMLTAAESSASAAPEKQDRSLGTNSVKRGGDTPVPPCVQAGTGRTEAALAAEPGEYQGKKAFLVVMPHSTDVRRVEAYIVDAACMTSKAPKGDLLLTHSYPRP